jgi:uncharacterized RDD family membrane protein YckC
VAAVGSLPSVSAPSAPTSTPRYASFWQRVGAYLIDSLIVGIPFSIANAVLVSPPADVKTATDPTSGQVTTTFTGDWATFLVLFGLFVIANWLYVALLLSSPRQATVGKMALSLVVTDEDGQRISFARASGRYCASWLNSLTLGVGWLMVIWTDRKQALSDKVAATLVVRRTS